VTTWSGNSALIRLMNPDRSFGIRLSSWRRRRHVCWIVPCAA
jgi:hypothetical protein